MEFYRGDKIRWPIAVIFDPIELGPECTQSPRAGCLRAIYTFARNICAASRSERGRSNDGIRVLVKGRLGAGMDIDVSD